MSDDDVPLRELRTEDIEEMASVLARAFQDDPLYRFLCPDPARRRAVLPRLFANWMRCAARTGRVWVSLGGEGAALWRTPGRYFLTFWDQVRSGMLSTPWVLGWGVFFRLVRISRELRCRARRAMRGPFWYCWLLGVEPSEHDSDFGGALMRRGFQQADAARLPCYLETATERNVERYLGYGYRVVEQLVFGKNSLRIWIMRREAA